MPATVSTAARGATTPEGVSPPPAQAYVRVRSAFAYFDPKLGNPAFMENAGGSQVPMCVADAVRDHMLFDCAQLDAGHEVSVRSTAAVDAAHHTMAAFMGANIPGGSQAPDPTSCNTSSGEEQGSHAATSGIGAHSPGQHGYVALGPSSSQLLATLGDCYGRLLGPGDEVVVQESCHEANAGPWVRCAERSGATLRWWRTDITPFFRNSSTDLSSSGGSSGIPAAGSSSGIPAASSSPAADPAALHVSFPCSSQLSHLKSLLSERTRVVAVTHVSNLLGAVLDVPHLVALVRQAAPRACLVVDGVAYAPHHLVDVSAWGVDWYALSIYKVWGPHTAALYGSSSAFEQISAVRGPNHFWISPSSPSYWFELGGVSHEACSGINAVGSYLRLVAASIGDSSASYASPTAAAAEPSSVDTVAAPSASKDTTAYLQETAKAAAAATSAAAAAVPGGTCSRASPGSPLTRAEVQAAYKAMHALEAPLTAPIINLLSSHPNVIVIGPDMLEGRKAWGSCGAEVDMAQGDGWVERVPTISFVHITKTSQQVAREIQGKGFAIRNGHAYARRLMGALAPVIIPYLRRKGCQTGEPSESAVVDDGVVRISVLHYNTPEEVQGLLNALAVVL